MTTTAEISVGVIIYHKILTHLNNIINIILLGDMMAKYCNNYGSELGLKYVCTIKPF